MKSNEEYLDELLKSMGGDSNEDTALTRLQSDRKFGWRFIGNSSITRSKYGENGSIND